MVITIIKVIVLLCFLIIPLRGPAKRRETGHKRPDKTIECSNYGINERGELEKILIEDNDDQKG